MENPSKPCQRNQGFDAQKPYRSPIERERYGFETLEAKGAVELRSSTPTAGASVVEAEPHAPGPTRIILSPEQAAELDGTEAAFVVVARGSYPDAVGRMVLHAVPSTVPLIDRAVAVAQGRLLTRKPPKK